MNRSLISLLAEAVKYCPPDLQKAIWDKLNYFKVDEGE